jgi:hypothetical protein
MLGLRYLPKGGNLPMRVERVEIKFVPGKMVEVDDDLDLSGAVDAGFVVEITRKVIDEPVDAPMSVEVGVMTATIDPGEDGKLNTEDDKVTITPTRTTVSDMEAEDEEEAKAEVPPVEESKDDVVEDESLDGDGAVEKESVEEEPVEEVVEKPKSKKRKRKSSKAK